MIGAVQELDAKDWVKVRTRLDGQQSYLTWTGSVYALIPGEAKTHLFKIIGMNVSRCIKRDDGGWDFTSRELTFYLDPKTGELLNRWENPLTGEILPVVHVANSPVQGRFKGIFPAKVEGDLTTFVFDLFSSYPNPLADDDKFLPYSPNPIYQAVELFKLAVPSQELQDDQAAVSNVILSWDRIGPWVPWMKMGDRPGQLIYSASGGKVSQFDQLPPFLQEQINTRVPLYRNAAETKLDSENITSWRYFKRHFDAYLAGNQFPISE